MLFYFLAVPDFNPLHREGGDCMSLLNIGFPVISIHSTARVETQENASLAHPGHIFQSTPPRGWRLMAGRTACMTSVTDFNPLHREGGDLYLILSHTLLLISIHSTARVETASPG